MPQPRPFFYAQRARKFPRVQQAVSSGLDADQERAARLVGFADRMRALHVRRAAVHAGGRILLVLVPLAIVVAWLLPLHRWTTVAVVALAALVAATMAGLRARTVADAALLRVRGGGGAAGLDLVGDELATWLEWQPREAGGVMVAWLGRAVEEQLPGLPASALQAVGRRPFGRLLYLLPLALLLLLAWWLLEWYQPPWAGVLGGRPKPPPSAGSGPGESQGSGSSSPSPSSNDPSQSNAKRPQPSQGAPPPPPRAPKPDPEPPPQPEPPAPLIDLPGNQHFVLPEHIDDGPTRKMRMRAAELPEPEAGNVPPPTATAGNGKVPPPPPPSAATFERAAEQAQRSRHVPAEEQPMVRRFFELLQKAAR